MSSLGELWYRRNSLRPRAAKTETYVHRSEWPHSRTREA